MRRVRAPSISGRAGIIPPVSDTNGKPGVLLDVDGTLLDTNYLHALAWWQAFRDAWSSSVIFGKTPVDSALSDAAAEVDDLAAQS